MMSDERLFWSVSSCYEWPLRWNELLLICFELVARRARRQRRWASKLWIQLSHAVGRTKIGLNTNKIRTIEERVVSRRVASRATILYCPTRVFAQTRPTNWAGVCCLETRGGRNSERERAVCSARVAAQNTRHTTHREREAEDARAGADAANTTRGTLHAALQRTQDKTTRRVEF